MFVTRNKIFMTSKNKNIMTSLILEEMEKRGRRQVEAREKRCGRKAEETEKIGRRELEERWKKGSQKQSAMASSKR